MGWLVVHGDIESDSPGSSFCMVNSNNFIKLRVYMNRSENRTGGLFLSVCMCMHICCKRGHVPHLSASVELDLLSGHKHESELTYKCMHM